MLTPVYVSFTIYKNIQPSVAADEPDEPSRVDRKGIYKPLGWIVGEF